MGNSTCKHPERPVKQQARTRLLALLSRSPPPAAQGPRLRFARSWALRSRLGAGGARRARAEPRRTSHQKTMSQIRVVGLTAPRCPHKTKVQEPESPASNPIKDCDSKKPVQEGPFGLIFFGAGHVAEIQRGPQPRGVKGRNLEICSKREGSPL